MGPHSSTPGRATHGTDQSQHMLCCPLLHKRVVMGVVTWRGASLLVIIVLAATAATRGNEKPTPTCHTPVIPRKLPCFRLHGNAFPFSSTEISLFCCYLWRFEWDLLERKTHTDRKRESIQYSLSSANIHGTWPSHQDSALIQLLLGRVLLLRRLHVLPKKSIL